jgi:hypothetical protein
VVESVFEFASSFVLSETSPHQVSVRYPVHRELSAIHQIPELVRQMLQFRA